MDSKIVSTSCICFALSAKGGYYGFIGEITECFTEALLFSSPEVAIAYRNQADKYHQVEQSLLLRVTCLIESEDS